MMVARIEILCDGFRSAFDADLDTLGDDEVGMLVRRAAKSCAEGRRRSDERAATWADWPEWYRRHS